MRVDYPNIRNSHYCPFCSCQKDIGLVACWPCYRAQDMRNGETAGVRETLINLESSLRSSPMPSTRAPAYRIGAWPKTHR